MGPLETDILVKIDVSFFGAGVRIGNDGFEGALLFLIAQVRAHGRDQKSTGLFGENPPITGKFDRIVALSC